MAKKTKKQTRNVSGASTASRASSTAAESTASVRITDRMPGSDFNPDYSTTIKDLKRIGVLAGTFFTVLVILSFFLR